MATRKTELVMSCDATSVKDVMNFLNAKMAELIKKRDQLNDKGEQNWTSRDRQNFNKWGKDIKALGSALQKNREEMVKYGQVMEDLAGARTKDLKRAFGELKRELNNMSARDPRRQQLLTDLKRVQKQIEENTGAINKNQSAWGALGTTLKNLVAYAGVFAMFNRLKSTLTDLFEKNKQMSDQLANIRKVSGLAMQDINQLNRNLAKIDTRSSIQQLNELAYVGSKLGFGEYGTEGLESFVKSAVKVQNALKEDMGEDAMTALSKMVEVMGLIPKMGVERAMDATGSAIFKLASTSTATGTNIVEFSKRLMGLANIAHITTPELLAFGSAADAMALMPEVAATAFNKLITAMQKQPNLIENALKMPEGTISDLFQAGHMADALVAVFEKMRETGGMNALMHAGVFKDLGSDGARLVAVMATMANRVDILNKHMATSRQAFDEGTAVAQEYAIQMDTAAAYSERAANMWEKAFVNPDGVDVVKDFTKAWYEVTRSFTQSEKVMGSCRLVLEGILFVIKALLIKLPELLAVVGLASTWAWITRLREGEGLIASLTSWFKRLSIAQKAFFKAAGWLGLALTIYEVGKALYDMFNTVKEGTEFMKGFNRELSDLNTESGKAEAELSRYRRAIDEAASGTKQRAAAINTFNSKFGSYLKNLLTEKSTAADVAKAYQSVNQALRTKLALQLKEKDINEQVLPREQWAATARQTYEQRAQAAGLGQYGSTWITGFAQDHRGTSVNDLVHKIGKDFYDLPEKVITEILLQGRAGNREFNNYGNIINRRYLPQANALLAADAYFRQERAAENAMRAVNKKWKPEQDAMNNMLAAQQATEPIGPLNPKPDPAAARELAKQESERRQALRRELQDAQRNSNAIMSKIEEWYRMQETIITGFAASGEWTQQQADVMIDQLNIAKNQALAAARRGITGRDESAWAEQKQLIGALMFDTSEASHHLLQEILAVNLQDVRTAIAKIDSAGEDGISSTALKDSINKNAAGNDREVQRIMKKSAKEVEKMLKQYDYLQQAIDSFDNRLMQLGLLTESAAAAARSLQTGNGVSGQERHAAIGTAAQQFIRQGSMPYTINPNDSAQLGGWLANLTGATANGNGGWNMASWTAPLAGDLTGWLSNIEGNKAAVQAFYYALIDMETQYYEAKKKHYEEDRKMQEERMRASGEYDIYESSEQQAGLRGKLQNAMGVGLNFGQQFGLESAIENDPEIERIKLRMEWRARELADAQSRGLAQELINQRQTELLEEFSSLAEKVSASVASRVQTIQSLTEPISTFAEEAGQKMGDMILGLDSQENSFSTIVKNMVLSLSQATIKMGAQWITQKIQQALVFKQMEADESLHQNTLTMIALAGAMARLQGERAIEKTAAVMKSADNAQEVTQEVSMATILTSLGISKGAAKIIGKLGWWGIPLVAVISSLLMGLLSSALSTAGSETAAATSTAATSGSNVKTRVVTGMLTYDEGNVGTYIGNNGKVYRARRNDAPRDGLITQPIATTVQGQPALVAEEGPEIVIGRRTTRAIQMNEPELINYLANYERYQGIYRTFDAGNNAAQSLSASGTESAETRGPALAPTLAALTVAVSQLQQELHGGIKSTVDMYGSDGLYESMKQANEFMQKYEG